MLGLKNNLVIWHLFKSFPNRFVIYDVTIKFPIESPMVSCCVSIPNSPGSRVQDWHYRGYLYPPKTNYPGLHDLVPQLYLSPVEALEQLRTMGIRDLMITFSQMLEGTETLVGIKDHSNTLAEMMNAYNAKYKKLCAIWGANFHCAVRLKWLENQMAELNVDLELAANEARLNRVAALGI